RHSPQGRTESGKEKLRQMASASMRAYLDGEDTGAWRRHIVLSYLNTVPLSAQPGFGEVNGSGDGPWAWYARDWTEVNRPLAPPPLGMAPRRALAFNEALLPLQALAYKQALSLMIAQRRPSHYLVQGEMDLNALTNSYLRVMADAGIVSAALRDAALPLELKLRTQAPLEVQGSFIDRKAATAVRGKLANVLDISRSYDLDRLDLRATTTLDGEVQ